ncbi:shewanella-like protein phosphatase 2 [Panicum virgatum]|uniref:shewanella-like protein phosphatase 2 n=1 Tax=Panicum virgatum TaxID=38727 RepID=UPI0019D538A3|nr:shewanella-like protein phosphatase 2 [Panicum virgatum]
METRKRGRQAAARGSMDYCSGMSGLSGPSGALATTGLVDEHEDLPVPPRRHRGPLRGLHSALRLAGFVLASSGPESPFASTSWTAGPILTVQLGDILNRGTDELHLLYLLRRLALSAEARGGALLPILGNHEVMNVSSDFRFATLQGLLTAASGLPH